MNKNITLLLVTMTLFASQLFAAEDVILGDFNDGTYQGWTAEGDAFDDKPASYKRSGSTSEDKNTGLVNTNADPNDPMGTLTSPEFPVFNMNSIWKK